MKRLKSCTRLGTMGQCRPLYNACDVNNSKTHLFVLYSRNYAASALLILFNRSKKSLLKSSYPKKNTCQIFVPKKTPRVKNYKPEKILQSSPSLEILSTPPPPCGYNQTLKRFLLVTSIQFIYSHCLLAYNSRFT